MDESEAMNSGNFVTYEQALSAAKGIVERYFVDTTRPLDDLMNEYCLFGEAPVIISNADGSVDPGFSARDYAEAYVEGLKKSGNRI